MNNKKRLLTLVIILLLIIGCFCLSSFFNSSDKNDTDNDIVEEDDVVDDADLVSIILNNDKYLWKMKVANKHGAYVYEKDNYAIISKLDYGTEISILGDYVSYSVFQEESVDYDNFTLNTIKNHYYFLISYVGDSENNIGYISYNDVTLVNENNYFSNEYNDSKKYYVSSNEIYLYDGPGLLFEKEQSVVIPQGELLEVKYYNKIMARDWLYVKYKNYSGWITQCRYHEVNDPYSGIIVNNCVEEVISESGKLTVNQDRVFLYKDVNSKEKIDVITSGSEITYDYKLVEPGIIKYHTNYNELDGFVIGVDVSEEDCDKDNDGKLYIMAQSDGSIKTCS